jgi:hypothetical protein
MSMNEAQARKVPEGQSGGPLRVERCPFCGREFPIKDLRDELAYGGHIGAAHGRSRA